MHVLSALEIPSALWSTDAEAARESLGASISLLMRLVGRDPDPTKSRDHVMLSVLAERRLRAGEKADVAALLSGLAEPPIETIGAMAIDEYLSKRERHALATALNTLLASPTFEAWRQGLPLDVGAWLAPREDGRTPAVIVSVAHLDQGARAGAGRAARGIARVGANAEGHERIACAGGVRRGVRLSPAAAAQPPTKRPLVELMKQARAFGVGLLIATQNPMDADYRALSNAGLWFVGR